MPKFKTFNVLNLLSITDLINCILWPMAQKRSGLKWGHKEIEKSERERENHVSLFCACVTTHGTHNSTPPPERRRAITKISNTKYSDNNNVITIIRMK